MKEVAAILLAAGRSRRMGAFKPLLPFGSQTVIQSCITNLRTAGVKEIVVVTGHRGDEVRAHLSAAKVSFALNSDRNTPMSVSIARGTEQLDPAAAAVLIALVDQPAIPAETIRAIIEAWRRGALLVQPEHHGRGGHPVVIDMKYRDELRHLNPDLGLREFFQQHRRDTQRLPVASPYISCDMDTWEDYLGLHKDVFGRLPDVEIGRFPQEFGDL